MNSFEDRVNRMIEQLQKKSYQAIGEGIAKKGSAALNRGVDDMTIKTPTYGVPKSLTGVYGRTSRLNPDSTVKYRDTQKSAWRG